MSAEQQLGMFADPETRSGTDRDVSFEVELPDERVQGHCYVKRHTEGTAKEAADGAEERRTEDRSGCEQKQDQVGTHNSDSYLITGEFR